MAATVAVELRAASTRPCCRASATVSLPVSERMSISACPLVLHSALTALVEASNAVLTGTATLTPHKPSRPAIFFGLPFCTTIWLPTMTYGMKSATCARSAVTYSPLTPASMRLPSSAGITPLNSMPIMLEVRLSRLPSDSMRSTSKPCGLPSRMNSNGLKVGELPQVSLPGSTVFKSWASAGPDRRTRAAASAWRSMAVHSLSHVDDASVRWCLRSSDWAAARDPGGRAASCPRNPYGTGRDAAIPGPPRRRSPSGLRAWCGTAS